MLMTWSRPAVAHNGGRHLPLGRAQGVGHLAEAEEGEFNGSFAPVLLNGAREAVEVRQPAFQLRRLDLQAAT